MNWKGHLIVGIIVSAIVAFLLGSYFSFNYNWLTISISLGIAIIFSILPDADINSSKISVILRAVMFILGLILAYRHSWIYLILLVIAYFGMEFMLVHRGFIHSFIAGILASLVVFFITLNIYYSVIAFASYLSHLLVDGEFK